MYNEEDDEEEDEEELVLLLLRVRRPMKRMKMGWMQEP